MDLFKGDSIAKILPELVLISSKTNMNSLEVITSLLMSGYQCFMISQTNWLADLEDLKRFPLVLDLQSEADIETISEIKDNIWKRLIPLQKKYLKG